MNSLFNHDQVIYSIDTSALIAAFHEHYPIKNFPSLWRKIETLIKKEGTYARRCHQSFAVRTPL